MKCPNCKESKGIEHDIHSEGYSKNLYECDGCGTVWCESAKRVEIVYERAMVEVDELPTTSLIHTSEDHTKYSDVEDELVAEDQKVWFS